MLSSVLFGSPLRRVASSFVAASIAATTAFSVSVSAATEKRQGLNPKEYEPLVLKSKTKYNHNTSSYRFALPKDTDVSGLEVASFVMAKIGEDERPYTPVSLKNTKGYIEFLIKVYPQGGLSPKIAALKEGDTLLIKGPIQKLKYEPNMKKRIGMIAGGTGITPMLQVIDEILGNPQDKTELSLVFANIAEEDILLREKN